MSTDFLKEGERCGMVQLGLPAPVRREPAKEPARTRRVVRCVSTALSLSIAEWSARTAHSFSDGDSGKYRTNGRRDYELSVVCLPLREVRIKRGLRRSGGGCRLRR